MQTKCVSLLTVSGRDDKLEQFRNLVKPKDGHEVFAFEAVLPIPVGIKSVIGSRLIEKIEQPPFREGRTIWLSPEELQKISAEEFSEVIQALKNVRETGYACWHDWCLANWGSKMEAFETELVGKATYKICTADFPPFPIFQRLSHRFCELKLEVKAAQSTKHTPKFMEYVDGVPMHKMTFAPNSADAVRFACGIHGKDFDEEIRSFRDEILNALPPVPGPKPLYEVHA